MPIRQPARSDAPASARCPPSSAQNESARTANSRASESELMSPQRSAATTTSTRARARPRRGGAGCEHRGPGKHHPRAAATETRAVVGALRAASQPQHRAPTRGSDKRPPRHPRRRPPNRRPWCDGGRENRPRSRQRPDGQPTSRSERLERARHEAIRSQFDEGKHRGAHQRQNGTNERHVVQSFGWLLHATRCSPPSAGTRGQPFFGS